ncbi:hypothetical protein, partial [Klebsiella pneumoniae]
MARLFHIEQYNPIYPVLSSVFAEELVNHQVDHFFYPKSGYGSRQWRSKQLRSRARLMGLARKSFIP